MSCATTRLHTSVKDFSARGGATVIEVNGNVFIFGGADREQTHFQDLMAYRSSAAGASPADTATPVNKNAHFQAVKATGDVPMPRSGHSVVAYGKYILLFGGIDFAEEAVFNDLYLLDTETLEWGYVGESGAEVLARNSHSMGIVSGDSGGGHKSYLVIYGGASPEHGPLGDTIYAELPDPASIDEKFFVKWEVLGEVRSASTVATSPGAGTAGLSQQQGQEQESGSKSSANASIEELNVNSAAAGSGGGGVESVFQKATAAVDAGAREEVTVTKVAIVAPGSREMHGTCCCHGNMYISGGRNGNGQLLADVWALSVTPPSTGTSNGTGTTTAAATASGVVQPLTWQKCSNLQLPGPRCAHAAAIAYRTADLLLQPEEEEEVEGGGGREGEVGASLPTASSSSSSDVSPQMVLVGGFSMSGISNEILCTALPSPVSRGATMMNEVENEGSYKGSGRHIAGWVVQKQSTPIAGRFGLTVCALSINFIADIVENKKYNPIFTAQVKATAPRLIAAVSAANNAATSTSAITTVGGGHTSKEAGEAGNVKEPAVAAVSRDFRITNRTAAGILIFGGVCMDQDYGDLWLALLTGE
eukprot:CAMPEP_0175008500 /NCGR_PEP_ID=MMETSP0005-20121125/7010_1 /TAXON_ID=420556 /ORGANISM="Ochromonas sp., Strain CCMP1393" /LENGTH=589 /DNA_ID=CAMNT_0016264077 /DNA_START=6 /DNA_END=1775 /DNA_ORIENTATION=+